MKDMEAENLKQEMNLKFKDDKLTEMMNELDQQKIYFESELASKQQAFEHEKLRLQSQLQDIGKSNKQAQDGLQDEKRQMQDQIAHLQASLEESYEQS